LKQKEKQDLITTLILIAKRHVGPFIANAAI